MSQTGPYSRRWWITVISGACLIVAVLFLAVGYTLRHKYSHEENEAYRKHIAEKYSVFNFPTPDSLTFCGESVPLNRDDCMERLDREMLVNTYYHSNTFLCMKRAARWFGLICDILAQEGVPDDFKYLCIIESSLSNAVSPSGAAGYWQFLPETAKNYGLEVNEFVDQRYDVEKATRAACSFLKESYQQFGSWTMAGASYNMGRNGLAKATKTQQEKSYWLMSLNEETSRYIFRILAMKEIFAKPEKYGYMMRADDGYRPLEYRTVIIDSSITDLGSFCKSVNCSYRDLKYFNPWLRSNELPNKQRKTYAIKLPL